MYIYIYVYIYIYICLDDMYKNLLQFSGITSIPELSPSQDLQRALCFVRIPSIMEKYSFTWVPL